MPEFHGQHEGLQVTGPRDNLLANLPSHSHHPDLSFDFFFFLALLASIHSHIPPGSLRQTVEFLQPRTRLIKQP